MATRVENLKARLEKERDRIEKELTRSTSLEEYGEGIHGEDGGYGTHMADDAPDTYEKEQRLTLELNLRNRLEEIGRALHRVEQGSFGLCESCRQPIEEERLEALPFVSFCLSCTQRQEKRKPAP